MNVYQNQKDVSAPVQEPSSQRADLVNNERANNDFVNNELIEWAHYSVKKLSTDVFILP